MRKAEGKNSVKKKKRKEEDKIVITT